MVAAILHLDDRARATLEAVDQLRRGLPRRHDVIDDDLLLGGDAEIVRPKCALRVAPRGAFELLVIAEHAVDFAHVRKCCRLSLRRAARHHDAHIGPLARKLADRLPGLRHRFGSDRAGIDHNCVGEPCRLRLAPDRLRLIGVEPAAESHHIDGHGSAPTLNSAGSKRPSNSYSTGPVISTWSSRSRHSIMSSPPGNVTATLRSARLSRAAATATAQAADPQALVRPAPRSQVRTTI